MNNNIVNGMLLSSAKLNLDVLNRLVDVLTTVLESPDVVRTFYRQDLVGEFETIQALLARDCARAITASENAIAAAAVVTTTTAIHQTFTTTTATAAAPVVAPVQQAVQQALEFA